MENEVEARQVVLRENVLTDDHLEICPTGYYWKGHGGSPIKIVYYTYANEWSDREHILYAKTLDKALEKYAKVKGGLDEDTTATVECLAGEINDYI